ncbi:hypothetical protein BJX61DRAFT_542895 [Aspergillus egyptiacus]|nr:hypothetical protein BJX61DRAFT_542895 [Aspergillus egyptiacus]
MEDGQLCSITDRMRMTTQFKKRNPDIPLKAHKGEPLRLFSIYSPEAARVRALSVARIPPPDTLPPPAPTEAPDEIELTDEQARAMGLRPVRPRGRPPRGYLPSQHQRQTYRPYTAENIDIHVPSRPPPTKPGRPGTNADAGAQLPEPPADATPEQLIAFYKDLVARLAHDLAQARARADVAESTLKRRRESDADEQADRETLQADQSSDNHRDDATDAVQDDQPRPPKRSRTEQDFTRIPPQPWVEELRRKHQEDGKRFGARDAWLHARAHNEAHEDDPTQRIDDDPSAIIKALGTGTKLTGWVACDHCRVNGKGCGKGREVKCERCINMDLKCTYTHPKTLETIERFPAPAPVDQASGASTAPEQPVAPTNPPHPMPPSATSYIEAPPVAQMDAAIKVFESSQYTEADIATGMNTDIPDAPDLGQFDVQPVQPRTRNGGLVPGGNAQYAGVPPLAPPQSTPTANPDYSILAGSGFTNVFDDQLIPQSLPHPAQPNTFQQGNLGNYAPNGFRPRAPGPTNLLRLPSPTESSFLSSSSLETPSTGSFAMSFTEMLGSDALDWDGGFTNNGYHDDFSQFIDPNAGVPNQGVFQN